jgi:hypothetical protein
LVIAIIAPIVQAVLSAAKADFPTPRPSSAERFKLRVITALLHVIQPIARLIGRLEHGLTLWRKRTTALPRWIFSENHELWTEEWHAPDAVLGAIAALARQQYTVVQEGGDFDEWDIELSGGPGNARLVMATEEHGAGRQNLRFRCWIRIPKIIVATVCIGAALAALAASQGAWVAAGVIGFSVVVATSFSLRQSACAIAVFNNVLEQYQDELSARHLALAANTDSK